MRGVFGGCMEEAGVLVGDDVECGGGGDGGDGDEGGGVAAEAEVAEVEAAVEAAEEEEDAAAEAEAVEAEAAAEAAEAEAAAAEEEAEAEAEEAAEQEAAETEAAAEEEVAAAEETDGGGMSDAAWRAVRGAIDESTAKPKKVQQKECNARYLRARRNLADANKRWKASCEDYKDARRSVKHARHEVHKTRKAVRVEYR
jgi:hypothetical protein